MKIRREVEMETNEFQKDDKVTVPLSGIGDVTAIVKEAGSSKATLEIHEPIDISSLISSAEGCSIEDMTEWILSRFPKYLLDDVEGIVVWTNGEPSLITKIEFTVTNKSRLVRTTAIGIAEAFAQLLVSKGMEIPCNDIDEECERESMIIYGEEYRRLIDNIEHFIWRFVKGEIADE